ncbi:MAG TPA: 30S ribosomal protein S12 methylthiotransferase RimO [Desulfomonilaceae bacterium]|nr:30S ribosomal protein S12 methylthiotransferase RimO [Desulfomonilaceae bacterium]
MKANNLFNLVSLGCPKNRVDSERILAVMTSAGFTFTEDAGAAAVIIINTCAFIEPAVQESIDTILDYREDNKDAFIVVAGCLPMRYKGDLEESLPEVNLFLPADRIQELPGIVRTALRTHDKDRDHAFSLEQQKTASSPGRVLTTAGYAYLKIAEGCSRSCRYCTIPSIRGPLQSTDCGQLEREAHFLASRGVRELILVAQDLTAYGGEKGEKKALIQLLRRLDRVEGIRWIRLMYLYPDTIPRDLATTITESEKILPYLDIPLQHVSEKVLKAMGRPWKGNRIRKLIESLKMQVPGLALRTTLMVGYPAEGETEFRELSDFVATCDIEHVGVFTYSPEEGTSAFQLGDPVPGDVKDARAEELRSIHSEKMLKRNRRRIGSVEECLVQGVSLESDLLLEGRLWHQAPEIDGTLYITAGNAIPGEIHRVRITGTHESDFFGELTAE